ncbi:MAG TPA: OmpA family protein [Rhodocyclaceae bacterium]|jgi:outer membrane protein OmpA-like peptidoglycan-associated protein|nr:OmpA family protein [Betaproteobacteria bacterium]HMV00208.1 OmpA family protein [Rhodocyclaceae bacterium]HMV19660.1 OmpA family protein [Rhodocyclaceae bacterium]HMW76352.1 OmpA family protein [Rhodocyclaceae bacterium]HNE43971.1 OmpA family protein [Rhodocyclaceae bacterium]
MAANDDDETTAVFVGALAGIMLAATAAIYGASAGKLQVAPPAVTAEAEIAPLGEALAKVYFALGKSDLDAKDRDVVTKTTEALAAKPDAIVLLSGFHDPSGDAAQNAELAKSRALAVKEALVAGGIAADRVKMRRPESTVGTGSPEEGRRVEIRVQ